MLAEAEAEAEAMLEEAAREQAMREQTRLARRVEREQAALAEETAAKRAAAASSFAQAERSAGLRVGGLSEGKHPKLHGAFTRDAKDPDANGRPHWSTAEGGHLYYSTDGRWLLHVMFTPDRLSGIAGFATTGEVPAGEAAWQYWDGSKMVERVLTVTED
jgi:hypothetical protein